MLPETFIDDVTDINFAKGIVRIELGSFGKQAKGDGEAPDLESRVRLLMTVEGLLLLNQRIGLVIKEFVDRGILRPEPEEEPASGDGDAPASPNFSN